MTSSRHLLTACLAVLIATPLAASEFVETFDGGSNVGGWTYYAPNESIPQTGGNPGAYLRAEGLDTFAPWPRTPLGVASIFTGDYRAMNVVSVGVDLATFYVDFSAGERNCTIMLYSDNGTPGFFDDDWAAFKLGEFVPEPGEGWRSFDFAIPSQDTDWPAGWDSIQFGPASPAPDWNALMANVASVGFHYGDPTWFYIFQMWILGLDNPRITTGTVAVQSESWTAVKELFR